MALLDSRFFLMSPLQQVIFDKTLGQLLAGGIVNFYADYQRTIPKNVYELSASPGPNFVYNNLGATLTLSSIGSFVDEAGKNITPYLYPYTGTPDENSGAIEYYFIDVLDANGSLQFSVDAYPNLGGTGQNPTSFSDTDNEVINPQFVNVLFNGAANTYTVNGANVVTNIAPGWSVVTSGTGSFTVAQTPISDPAVPTNPPYALTFSGWSGGIISAKLVQDFVGSPRLLSNNFVNGSFIALTLTGTPLPFTMNYNLAGPDIITPIVSGLTSANSWTQFNHTAAIVRGGVGFAPNAKSTLSIVLPVGSSFLISSIQLVGVATGNDTVEYIEQSYAQQVNDLFSYYQPQINFKPSPSFLIGWDFPLNPAQFAAASVAFTSPKYIWDQTIGATNVGNVTASATPLNDGIQFVNDNAGESFYIMQYLDGSAVQNMLGNPLSVNIFGFANTINVTARVYLFRAGAGAIFPDLNFSNSIGTMGANGIFTLTQAGWSAIKPLNYADTSGTLPFVAVNSDINNVVDLKFPGFQITDSTELGDTSKFAIVVTFSVPTISTLIRITSISLTQGMIPTRPAPQEIGEVLRECRRFYETTYDSASAIGAANAAGPLVYAQNTTGDGTHVQSTPTAFCIQYKEPKRVVPKITFYSVKTNATTGFVTGYLWGVAAGVPTQRATVDLILDLTGSSYWTAINTIGMNQASYIPVTANIANAALQMTANGSNFVTSNIAFHCTIDARLGLV